MKNNTPQKIVHNTRLSVLKQGFSSINEQYTPRHYTNIDKNKENNQDEDYDPLVNGSDDQEDSFIDDDSSSIEGEEFIIAPSSKPKSVRRSQKNSVKKTNNTSEVHTPTATEEQTKKISRTPTPIIPQKSKINVAKPSLLNLKSYFYFSLIIFFLILLFFLLQFIGRNGVKYTQTIPPPSFSEVNNSEIEEKEEEEERKEIKERIEKLEIAEEDLEEEKIRTTELMENMKEKMEIERIKLEERKKRILLLNEEEEKIEKELKERKKGKETNGKEKKKVINETGYVKKEEYVYEEDEDSFSPLKPSSFISSLPNTAVLSFDANVELTSPLYFDEGKRIWNWRGGIIQELRNVILESDDMTYGKCLALMTPPLQNTSSSISSSNSTSTSNSSSSSSSSSSSNTSSSNTSSSSSSSFSFTPYVDVHLHKPQRMVGVSLGSIPVEQTLDNASSSPRHFIAKCLCYEENEEEDEKEEDKEEDKEENEENKRIFNNSRCIVKKGGNKEEISKLEVNDAKRGVRIVEYSEIITKGEYKRGGPAYQFFGIESNIKKNKKINNIKRMPHTSIPCDYVQFEFLDNYGNEDYTCIYRVLTHPYVERDN